MGDRFFIQVNLSMSIHSYLSRWIAIQVSSERGLLEVSTVPPIPRFGGVWKYIGHDIPLRKYSHIPRIAAPWLNALKVTLFNGVLHIFEEIKQSCMKWNDGTRTKPPDTLVGGLQHKPRCSML